MLIMKFLLSQMILHANIERDCLETLTIKSSLNRGQIQKTCKDLDNYFAFTCTKIAMTYMRSENNVNLIQSCKKIDSEDKLKCVIKDALNAKRNYANQITKCSAV